jgi:hypothetical protein
MQPIPAKQIPEPEHAVDEDVGRLNLSYLLTVRHLVASGKETQAEIVFGLQEPLASWLRTASAEAIAALAGSPILVYEPRQPRPSLERILEAYEGASTRRWLATAHLAMSSAQAGHAPAG